MRRVLPRVAKRELVANSLAYQVILEDFQRGYNVEVRLVVLKGIGRVLTFHKFGKDFWFKVYNRLYKIEPSHISQEFLELEGSKWIVSASTFTKKALELLGLHDVKYKIMNWKLYPYSWKRRDEASLKKAKLYTVVSWHRDFSPHSTAERKDFHIYDKERDENGEPIDIPYCSRCARFIAPLPELARAPQIAYGTDFFGEMFRKSWERIHVKRRRGARAWSAHYSLASSIARLEAREFQRLGLEPLRELGRDPPSIC